MMTDQNDHHESGEAAGPPVTFNEAATGNLTAQAERYRELVRRDTLTVPEYLEALAIGEHLAEFRRHPAQVARRARGRVTAALGALMDKAVRAGATWEQIAAATGTTDEATRAAYVEWAEGQHQIHGLDDAGYAAAIARAED